VLFAIFIALLSLSLSLLFRDWRFYRGNTPLRLVLDGRETDLMPLAGLEHEKLVDAVLISADIEIPSFIIHLFVLCSSLKLHKEII